MICIDVHNKVTEAGASPSPRQCFPLLCYASSFSGSGWSGVFPFHLLVSRVSPSVFSNQYPLSGSGISVVPAAPTICLFWKLQISLWVCVRIVRLWSFSDSYSAAPFKGVSFLYPGLAQHGSLLGPCLSYQPAWPCFLPSSRALASSSESPLLSGLGVVRY